MPHHMPIEGGKATGKPLNWNDERDGVCDTLSVLYGRDQAGHPTMTSAWRLTPAELQALQRDGAMFLQIHGEQHPVIALWIQGADGSVIALDAEPEIAPAALDLAASGTIPQRSDDPRPDIGTMLTAALGGAVQELDAQAEGPAEIGDMDDAGQIWISGTINLKAVVEAALEAAAPLQPAGGLVQIPVLTLGAVAAEGQAKEALEQIGRERRSEPPIFMWTISRNPSDYPCKHVARKWAIGPMGGMTVTPDTIIGDTLEEVRGKLPPNMLRMDREPSDDSCIVETWI